MKEEKIFNAITDVPDELIEEAKNTPLKQRSKGPWLKWGAAAACMIFVIAAALTLPTLKKPDAQPTTDPTEPVTLGPQPSYQALYTVSLPKPFSLYDDNGKKTIRSPFEEKEYLSSLKDFSYNTAYEILNVSKGNINYSPLSLYFALSLVATGAEGKTAEELNKLLGASDKQSLSEWCNNLYRILHKDDGYSKLEISNSLWMNKLPGIKQDFVKNAAENFYAEGYNVDFSDTRAKELMKNWVKDNTGGTITPDVQINPNELMSIINTVYFSGQWLDKFEEKDTKKGVFYTDDNTQIQCDFMHRAQAQSDYYKGENFSRASLMLSAGYIEFILPDKGVAIDELLSSEQTLKSAFESDVDDFIIVNWQLPKFSFGSSAELKDVLQKLGVGSAFSSDADFSGISDEKAWITSVAQNTHIGIDENGVVAASYTKLGYGLGGPVPRYADMILNRPFIFGIFSANDIPLFIGVCRNPAES